MNSSSSEEAQQYSTLLRPLPRRAWHTHTVMRWGSTFPRLSSPLRQNLAFVVAKKIKKLIFLSRHFVARPIYVRRRTMYLRRRASWKNGHLNRLDLTMDEFLGKCCKFVRSSSYDTSYYGTSYTITLIKDEFIGRRRQSAVVVGRREWWVVSKKEEFANTNRREQLTLGITLNAT